MEQHRPRLTDSARRVRRTVPLAARVLVLALVVGAAAVLSGTSAARSVKQERRIVVRAVVRAVPHRRAHTVRATVTAMTRGWAYGYVEVAAKRTRGDGPGVSAAFLARRIRRRWVVAFQGTTAYGRDVLLAPKRLIPAMVRKLDAPPSVASTKLLGGSGPAAAPQFELPWAAGQTWHLWLGPHNTDNDFGPHPYTSLDFAGGDGIVRAAAAGTVYRPCTNLVVVDHGGGWETGYYHLPAIYVRNGQTVAAGQALGTTGTAVGCGGYAHGAHVHFSVYHFATSGVRNVFQTPSADMDGVVIGDWVVHDGPRSGLGYMQHLSDGAIVYPSDTSGTGSIYNDGTAGGARPAPPTGYVTLAAINVRSGPGLASAVVGSLANGAPVSIACQTRGDSVNGSSIWDQLSAGGYVSDYYVSTPVVGGFSPGLTQCSPNTTTTSTTTTTTTTLTTTSSSPPPPVNRQAVTSYNRMAPGAPYHGQFIYAWQPFTAQSNTITSLGVTVGSTHFPAGQPVGLNVTIRLCTNQPDSNGNCNAIGQTAPQVINYGDSRGDIGDVAVTPGTTYWIEYFPPQPYGNGWVAYWWAGGPSISQSDQMQAVVLGYNR